MRELPPVRLDTVNIRYYASAIVITEDNVASIAPL